MRKRLVMPMIALLLYGMSSAVPAVAAPNPGPEVINLKMGVMVLPFQHRKHQKDLNNECFHCHTRESGKIDNWGKDTAHKICISCHDLYDKGPVECQQCHKK
ncbi:cytochrome c3 family protein [Oryzomonas japonica]|uniref:Cytochrome c3 family protein n=1 Tax=Oryzomonas japonica TaxID=2603858 RepID=A0A7J4ZMD9_9BACT|nr:cytochrome c3 family protein [Oryzomonas japonica]KAB0663543.1 cytochrome c3 family protein [Oryzomonas japonica]